MYDRNLANALGYGDVSSTNNPKPRKPSPWGSWQQNERELNQPTGPTDYSTGQNQPYTDHATVDYTSGSYPNQRGFQGRQQQPQNAMGNMYNRQRPLGPLQQTGFQRRFANPMGMDSQAPQATQPSTQETNLSNAITKQGRGFTNAQGSWGNFNYTPGSVGQYTNQLEGFDLNKLNPEHADNNTMKYIFATAASNVDVNDPEAGAKVVAELQKMGINATLEGQYGDRIKFPTGESVDVIRNSGRVGGDPNATLGWQWIDAAYDGQQTPGAAGGLDPMSAALLGGNFDPTMLQNLDPSNPILAQIMAILAQQNAVR